MGDPTHPVGRPPSPCAEAAVRCGVCTRRATYVAIWLLIALLATALAQLVLSMNGYPGVRAALWSLVVANVAVLVAGILDSRRDAVAISMSFAVTIDLAVLALFLPPI